MNRVIAIALLSILSVVAYAQNGNKDWDRLGYVWRYKPDPGNKFRSYSCGKAIVYGSFDGNKMTYKIFIPQENETYDVYTNPDYNQDKVEYCDRMSAKDDHFHGPWPSFVESYPQKAGDYYFNIGNISN